MDMGGRKLNERILQQMQLQRVIGELKVLQASIYNPATYNKKGDSSRNRIDFIENIIKDLKDNLG